MKTRAFVFVSIAAGLLVACSSIGLLGTRPSTCDATGNKCKATITVTACNQAGISATPDTIVVKPGKWKIEWTLATPGYSFTSDGITMKPGAPGGVFSNGNKDAPQKFSMDDDHKGPSTAGSFKYNVRVVDGSGNVCKYDPTVDNDA